jgi:hypothetical protein
MFTIGLEKRYTRAFQIDSEDELVRAMLADIPSALRPAAQRRTVSSGLAEAAE